MTLPIFEKGKLKNGKVSEPGTLKNGKLNEPGGLKKGKLSEQERQAQRTRTARSANRAASRRASSAKGRLAMPVWEFCTGRSTKTPPSSGP
jgi:hypothetical protein